MVDPIEENNRSNRIWVFMAIIIILLAINALQLYLHNQAKKEISEKTVIIEKQETDIKIYNTKIDSLGNELQVRYNEIAKLGGDTASMGELIRKLNKEKRSLAASKADIEAKYNQIKSQFDQIIAGKDSEIETLRAEREELFKENNQLKVKQVSLTDSVNSFKAKNDELDKQVKLAQVLKAGSVKVIFIRKDKEIDESEYKAKKVEKLKFVFDIVENKVAKIEIKTFYIRLIEPDGATLYDLGMGGGSFKVEDKDIFYTCKVEGFYDQTSKTYSMTYAKGTPYKVGKHTVEVWCDNNRIGIGGFNLK